MSNQSYQKREVEIDIQFVLWRLLSQWKAVLLAALIMACLVAGAKYYKDTSAYNSAKKELRAKELRTMEETATTAEGRIEEILAELPENDRSTVEFVLEQKYWIDRQTEYINDSILLNADPENQRRLRLGYCIETNSRSVTNTESLIYSYSELLRSEKSVKTIKKALDTEADDRYIAELVSIGDSGTGDSGTGDSGGMGKVIFLVNIVILEEADADAVEKAITAILSEYEPTLSSEIAPHSIKLMSANESYVYNTGAADRRTSLTNTINNLVNSIRNIQNNLTSSQKDAIEKISAIQKEEYLASSAKTADEVAVDISRPAFSAKSVLLGFILGCFAYAAAYLVWLILRGRVNAASDLESAIGVRLIGEVYELKARKDFIGKLLHSAAVDKLQYKGRLDADKQIEKLTSAITAICEHGGAKTLTLLNATGDVREEGLSQKVMSNIAKVLKKQGIKADFINIDEETNEKSISAVENAMVIASNDTRNKTLWDVATLCDAYGVKMCGGAFIANER